MNDKKLFKDVANHLQTEKAVRRTKINRVFSNLRDESETPVRTHTQPAQEDQQPTPAQAQVSQIKYKAPELSAKELELKFSCTSLKS